MKILQLRMVAMVMVWAAISADGHSPIVFIDRGVLSRKYAGGRIQALGTETFRPQTLEIPTGLSTIALRTHHSRMVKTSKEAIVGRARL